MEKPSHIKNDAQNNPFDLFKREGQQTATDEMMEIIESFRGKMSEWHEKYHSIGGADTATREAVAVYRRTQTALPALIY